MTETATSAKPKEPLDGNHHVTGITADVRKNLDFWCRVLGFRFIKKTLNFETNYRYHSYFSDREGTAGSVVTFLEMNEAPTGLRSGAGNIAAAIFRIASYEALEFWADRLTAEQVFVERIRLDPTQPIRLVFEDPEGHQVELMVTDAADAPLQAPCPDIPAAFRIMGIEGIRSCCAMDDVWPYAEHMGFTKSPNRLELQGEHKTSRWYFAPPPNLPHQSIAVGVWHHLALDAEDLQGWRNYSHAGPVPTTGVFDHHFFESCYAMTAGGVIELCNGPGFTFDQADAELGEILSLSKNVEPIRPRLDRELTPLRNPRNPDCSLKQTS